jgi:hypothetical protein
MQSLRRSALLVALRRRTVIEDVVDDVDHVIDVDLAIRVHIAKMKSAFRTGVE